MQTRFTQAQLADPDIAAANDILRSCVHCGFCNATCPTYGLTGDELDGPRGRIYLIKEMLEGASTGLAGEAVPPDQTVRHLDRCLSCLACMTTCPASVNYMHLVDLARAHVEKTGRRGWQTRFLRALIAQTVAFPRRFALSLKAARLAGPLARRLPGRLGGMAALAPLASSSGPKILTDAVYPALGERRARMALLVGCAQQVLAPSINAATIDLLTRHGVEIVVAKGAGCCGSLDHHLGKQAAARTHAAATITAWDRERDIRGLDAIIVNTSGCGTAIKDYGFIYRNDGELAAPAARIAELARDVSEVLAELDLQIADDGAHRDLRVAYHAPCSLQHGQQITTLPADLMRRAGFEVSIPRNAHLCCGSAGSYSLLEPEMANRLRDDKAISLAALSPQVVITGNIGCMSHLAPSLDVPILHLVELMDWATGGTRPATLTARL